MTAPRTWGWTTGPSPLSRFEWIDELRAEAVVTIGAARRFCSQDAPSLVELSSLAGELAVSSGARDSVCADVEAASGIRHGCFLGPLEGFEDAGRVFWATELVPGVRLDDLWRAASAGGHRIPIEVSLRIVHDVACAVRALHARAGRAWVHGDICPANVIVGAGGEARLVFSPFGRVACFAGATSLTNARLAYKAPEQLTEPTAAPDPRVDVFALGVMLWEAISGERLFDAPSDLEIETRVLSAPVPALGAAPIGQPSVALGALVDRALSRDVRRRVGSATELLAVLDVATAGSLATAGEVAFDVAKILGRPSDGPAATAARDEALRALPPGVIWAVARVADVDVSEVDPESDEHLDVGDIVAGPGDRPAPAAPTLVSGDGSAAAQEAFATIAAAAAPESAGAEVDLVGDPLFIDRPSLPPVALEALVGDVASSESVELDLVGDGRAVDRPTLPPVSLDDLVVRPGDEAGEQVDGVVAPRAAVPADERPYALVAARDEARHVVASSRPPAPVAVTVGPPPRAPSVERRRAGRAWVVAFGLAAAAALALVARRGATPDARPAAEGAADFVAASSGEPTRAAVAPIATPPPRSEPVGASSAVVTEAPPSGPGALPADAGAPRAGAEATRHVAAPATLRPPALPAATSAPPAPARPRREPARPFVEIPSEI